MLKVEDAASLMRHCESMGEYSSADTVRKLVIKGLSPQEKLVRKTIKENPWISTPDLAKKLGVKLNLAGTVAGRLYKLGLVRREHKYLGNLRLSHYWTWHSK